jgi:glycosyltransferase involved in cell wall biosynthesis
MIVRNEAHQLDRCLAPVAALFDDIVVVDTGSHDGTREAARRYTPHVVEFPWRDDFSAARNESLRHARGDWIFWLDADDRVSPENVDRLRQVLAGLGERPQAFLMQTVLHLNDQDRDRQRITSHLRLFRRHENLRWQRRVHEALTPWPTALGYELVFSDVRVEHLGYQNIDLTQRKLRRNVRLLRMDYAVSPEDPTVLMDLGCAQAQLGHSSEARRLLHAVLAQAPRCPLLLRRAYTTLGELETVEGNFTAAATLMESALENFPGDDYLLYMHSEALYNLGCYARAAAALKAILQQPPAQHRFEVGVPADLRARLAPLALGEVLRAQAALREAEEVLRGVAARFPADASAWFFLGRVYIDWGQWDRLDEAATRLSECPDGRLFAAILEAWSQLARGQWQAAEAGLAQLIPQAPSMTLLRRMRLECLHRRGAPREEQVRACGDLLRLQPHHARAREILQRLEAAGAHEQGGEAAGCTSVLLGAGVPRGMVSVPV